jgi:hypothetical protein
MRSITLLPRVLFGAAAWMAPVEWRQLAQRPFCVANTLYAAGVWLVLGAAVPRNLYRLKCIETQSELKFDRI